MGAWFNITKQNDQTWKIPFGIGIIKISVLVSEIYV